jgi:two-component system response regulator HydG
MLQDYDWVGNVRELENVLMQGVLLAKGEVLEEQNILLSKSKEVMNKENIEDFSLAVMEKAHIIFVLDKINWNKSKAAKLLKISKQTLYNKIKAYNITPPSNI